MSGSPQYWLVKSEPTSFSIDDLARCPDQTTCWDGVRNYQARNFMRQMRLGDRVLFYHSNADPPAVVGTARVVRQAYPDPTAWDRSNPHFDPKASPDNPIWEMVDLRLEQVFPQPISLDELRAVKALAGMELLRKGSRLSVQPVTKKQFETVLALAAGGASTAMPQAKPRAAARPKRQTPGKAAASRTPGKRPPG
jgi:predicted RNA-binding protein with PUA-like domain